MSKHTARSCLVLNRKTINKQCCRGNVAGTVLRRPQIKLTDDPVTKMRVPLFSRRPQTQLKGQGNVPSTVLQTFLNQLKDDLVKNMFPQQGSKRS